MGWRPTDRAPAYLPLAVAGAVASCVIVVAGGRVGPIASTVPLSSWLGLLSRHAVNAHHNAVPGSVLAGGVLALIGVWLLALHRNQRASWSRRELWTLAGAWSLPLVVGPPLLSSDVFSYAAQGLLVAHGHSPYTASPWAIYGSGPAALAVDPIWLFVHSPYGPLATIIEHASVLVGGGSALGAVIVMRVLAVASVVAIGVLITRLVPADRLPVALLLTIANPLVLLQVVSAAHFEGIMCALILAAILATVRGHPYIGLALGCAAGAVKAPALIVVFAIAFEMWHSNRRHNVRSALLRGGAVVVASWLVLTVLVPDGWGWLRGLSTPGLGSTSAAPSAWFAHLFALIMPSSSSADLSYAGRVAALGAALLVTGYLLVTAQSRPLASTAGLSMLIVALFGPVLYPWYALWGIVCLASTLRGRSLWWLIGLSAVLSTIALPGQTETSGACVTWGTVVLVAVFIYRSRSTPPETRRTLAEPARTALTGAHTDGARTHAAGSAGFRRTTRRESLENRPPARLDRVETRSRQDTVDGPASAAEPA